MSLPNYKLNFYSCKKVLRTYFLCISRETTLVSIKAVEGLGTI